MKPKNQKQFNWSYVRFYLMWLLTTMLALVPLAVLFSGLVKQDSYKNQSSADTAKGVEKVNYDEISAGINLLTGLVGEINKGNIQQNIDDLEDFADSIKINSNKKLGKQLEDLSEKVILICENYKDEINENKDGIRELKVKINRLEDEKRKLDIELTGCNASLRNSMNQRNNQ